MVNRKFDDSSDIDHILLTEKEIDNVVSAIAEKIDLDSRQSERDLLLLGILKGSVVFMGDLMKKLKTPVEIDFMKVSSYGASTESSGKVNILLDLHRNDLSDKDIIIVEDIIDSGRTLSYLLKYLQIAGAGSVKTCTLLDKPSRRVVDFVPDYTGFTIPDEFVVGYGLDFNEHYRSLPYIGVLKPDVWKN